MKNELHHGWKIAGRIAAVVALAAVASAQGGRMPGIPKWGGSRVVDPNPAKLEITYGKRSVLRMTGAPGALAEVTINLNERDVQIGKKGFGAARHTTIRGFFNRDGVLALDLPVEMPEFKVLHARRADSATIDGYKTVTVVLEAELAPEQPFASAQKLGDLARPLGARK